MSPSWYDLLDVDATASPAEIRSAWKAGIAELDPTDRKFRVLNQAAAVLLDPDRRAAYDAELAENEVEDSAAPGTEEPEEPENDDEADPDEQPPETVVPADPDEAPKSGEPKHDLESHTSPGTGEPESAGRPGLGTMVLGALALVLVVATIVAFIRLDAPAAGSTASSPGGGGGEDVAAARQAAEQAVVPVLSYDYRQLEEDAAAARSYMTEEYASDYDQFFAAAIAENAPRTETKVEVQVVASGIVRTGADRVDVLLFVNRPTTNSATPDPVIYKDQVTVQMLNVDGDWLVDGLATSPLAPE